MWIDPDNTFGVVDIRKRDEERQLVDCECARTAQPPDLSNVIEKAFSRLCWLTIEIQQSYNVGFPLGPSQIPPGETNRCAHQSNNWSLTLS